MVEVVFGLRFEVVGGTKELALAILRKHKCGHGERCRMQIALCWNRRCGFPNTPTDAFVRRRTRSPGISKGLRHRDDCAESGEPESHARRPSLAPASATLGWSGSSPGCNGSADW